MRDALERRAADWLRKNDCPAGYSERVRRLCAAFLLACIEDGTVAVCGECKGKASRWKYLLDAKGEYRWRDLPCPACTRGIVVGDK